MNMPSIKRNFIFNLFNQFVSFMIPLIVTPYTSRIFGADGIGINSYTTANIAYFVLFSMLGISGYGQREVAICRNDRRKVSELFCELQLLHLITFVFTSIIYAVLIFRSSYYRIYYIAHFITLISCFFDINWFYQAYEKFQFIAVRNCIIKLIHMCMIFLLIHKRSDLVLYIFITAVFSLLSNLVLWAGIKKYVDKIIFRELNIRRHIRQIIIFFIPTIAASVYSILDKSVINWITHEEAENGYYEQAYKILSIANVFVQTLSNVSSPRMANMYSEGDMDAFQIRLNRSLNFMIMTAMPVAFGIAGITPRFVPFFFGDGYDKVIELIYVFMPLVVTLGFSVYLDGMYLVPSGKRIQSAMAICAGSVLNLFLNIFMVTYFKSLGAAIATLITECFISVIMILLSRKMVNWKMIFNCILKYGIISAVMFWIVRLIGNLIIEDSICILIQILLGGGVYGILLLILKDKLMIELITGTLERFIAKKVK